MRYQILIPSGNPTALVVDGLYDKDERKKINDKIMLKHSFVEQVAFLDDDFNLVMAGGEKCLNAIRCAGYYYAKKLNLDRVNIKNCNENFTCLKEEDNICVKSKTNLNVTKIDDFLYRVKLDGITHLVHTKNLNLNIDELKEYSFNELKKRNLVDEKACGFMIFDGVNLKPIVYVKDIDTLFYESACGSGSLACVLVEFNKIGKDVEIKIKQPSDKYLDVFVKKSTTDSFEFGISGKIEEYDVENF